MKTSPDKIILAETAEVKKALKVYTGSNFLPTILQCTKLNKLAKLDLLHRIHLMITGKKLVIYAFTN